MTLNMFVLRSPFQQFYSSVISLTTPHGHIQCQCFVAEALWNGIHDIFDFDAFVPLVTERGGIPGGLQEHLAFSLTSDHRLSSYPCTFTTGTYCLPLARFHLVLLLDVGLLSSGAGHG